MNEYLVILDNGDKITVKGERILEDAGIITIYGAKLPNAVFPANKIKFVGLKSEVTEMGLPKVIETEGIFPRKGSKLH